MKISFLVPHLKVAGGIRIALGYADGLAARGHEVFVVVQNSNFLRRTIANVFNRKPEWQKQLRAQVVQVASWEQAPSADVIIADSWRIAKVFSTLQTSARIFQLVQHDERLYHGDAESVAMTLALPLRKIVVSSWLKQIVLEQYAQESDLLLNPVDRNLFHQVPRIAPEDTVRVLLLHHTYPWKGTAEGVEMVTSLKSRYPEIRLILFGSRGEEVSAYPCDEYYYNLPQEKLAQLYSNTDIYLCPSWEEGFGLPSIEAMHCGATLVTYDNGGSRDYAKDGETAFVAPHREVGALAEKLEQAVSDSVLRKKVARQGQVFVQSMPTWETQVTGLERILEQK